MSDTYTSPLAQYLRDWRPKPVTATDRLDPAQAARLADTLELTEAPIAGDELPIPWHWVYFSEWLPTTKLGIDGHPADGEFFPPIPRRRRMFAGSRITSHAPLKLGVPTERLSSVTETALKAGTSGDMLFVTVRSEYRQRGTVAMVEEQRLVYRSDSGSNQRFERAAESLDESSASYHHEPKLLPTHLFRYSALTSNTHRIHYDIPYATEVEGYPALVVHGPLLAHYMAELAQAHGNGASLECFEFRLQRPVFLGDRFRIESEPDADGAVITRVVSGGGVVHASGRGIYR